MNEDNVGIEHIGKMSPRVNLKTNPGLCLRLRHKKSGCRLCLDNCPTGAISFDQSLVIDSALCNGCSICANVCPTEVFLLSGLSYESLLADVRGASIIEFTCSQWQQGQDSLKVPCLGYLSESVLVGGIVCGAQTVTLNITPCKECNHALGLRVAANSLKQANRILALFGLPGKISARVSKPVSGYIPGEVNHYSRRELFSCLGKGTRGMVASAIEGTVSEREMPAKTKVTLETSLPKKRSLLLEHVRKLGEPVTDRAKADDLPFAQVEISDRCNGCGRCVTFCPTGALKSYEEGDRQVIDFSLGHCLACNLCRDICPEGAIVYSTDFNPCDLITDERKILIEHKKSLCLRCGQPYVGDYGSKVCLDCRKKRGLEEWLANMWEQARTEPGK